jgi:hypothetical protein
VTYRWFAPCTLVSSINKTGHHNIAEILLKVALNTGGEIKEKRAKRRKEGERRVNPPPI